MKRHGIIGLLISLFLTPVFAESNRFKIYFENDPAVQSFIAGNIEPLLQETIHRQDDHLVLPPLKKIDVDNFIKVLNQSKSLRSFCLHSNVSANEYAKILNAIKNTQITEVMFTFDKLSELGMSEFSKALNSSKITKLHFTGELEEKVLEFMCFNNSSLEELRIVDDKLNAEGFKYLVKNLSGSQLSILHVGSQMLNESVLSQVDFSKTKINDLSLRLVPAKKDEIVNWKLKGTGVKKLRLSFVHSLPEGILSLSSNLIDTQVDTLQLMGDFDKRALSSLKLKDSRVSNLLFPFCMINDRLLSELNLNDTKISLVDLSDNNITEKGLFKYKAKLKNNNIDFKI